MATPAGQCSLGDCNTEIMQRGFSNYIELSEPTSRLGWGGQRDMNQVRKAWAALMFDRQSCGKFGCTVGYQWGGLGGANDYTIDGGYLWFNGCYSLLFNFGNAQVEMTNGLGSFGAVGGWQGFDVDRIAYNGTQYGITNRQNYYFWWGYLGSALNGGGDEFIGIKYYS